MWKRRAVVLALVLLSCATSVDGPRSSPRVDRRPPLEAPIAGAHLAFVQISPPFVEVAPRAVLVRPPTRRRPVAFVARPYRSFLRTWHRPGAGGTPDRRLASSNAFGQRLSFAVERMVRDAAGIRWARIRTGEHPNGAATWIRARQVRLRPVRQRIVIDLSERRLTRFIGQRVAARLSVGIGDRNTPTAPGHYFVWAKVRYQNPTGPYGKLALGLSGFSRVVRFGLTPGRLAIHGTASPGDRGRAVSLGCVRVYNGQIGRLWHVPMGTPVIIRP